MLFTGSAHARRWSLFIDDLQWGDVDSAALLLSLLDAPDPPRVAAHRLLPHGIHRRQPLPGRTGRAREHQALLRRRSRPLPFADCVALARRCCPGGFRRPRRRPSALPRIRRQPVLRLRAGAAAESGGASDAASRHADLDEVLWRRVTMLPAGGAAPARSRRNGGKPSLLTRAADAERARRTLPRPSPLCAPSAWFASTGPSVDDEVETYHDRIRESVTQPSVANRRAASIIIGSPSHSKPRANPTSKRPPPTFTGRAAGDRAAQHYALAAETSVGGARVRTQRRTVRSRLRTRRREGASARQLHRSAPMHSPTPDGAMTPGRNISTPRIGAEPHDRSSSCNATRATSSA